MLAAVRGAFTRERALVYGAALLLGAVAMLLVLPLDALQGRGPGWNPPGPDQAQSLAGHLAFQADSWRWPLLDTQRLFGPHSISLVLVDGNPLVSILAKLWVHSTGLAPVNWLAAFLGVCWLLQPVAAVYAARGLGVRPWAALAAGVLACAWPALMFRMMHINLCGHFLILAALGMTFRRIGQSSGRTLPGVLNGALTGVRSRLLAGVRSRPLAGVLRALLRWVAPALLLVVSALTHPYFFQLNAAVLAAVPLQAALRRRAGWQQEAGLYLLSGVIAVGVLLLLAGPLGSGDKGFTVYSMNLGSPVWPQRSGVFGASLPILDATGGQYEGFNWLGAGTLLLLVATIIQAVVRRVLPRPALALVIVLVGLALLSLSSQVYAGPMRLLDLGVKPWEDIFGSIRASGRVFWPVGYALMLAGVAAADRLPRGAGAALLLAAVVLQVIDIQPLLRTARTAWATGSGVVVPPVPGGTTLFTVAPYPACVPEIAVRWGGPIMLLDAVRHGALLGDIGFGRSPSWFNCEELVSDALELPLLPQEVRAFVGTPIQAALRPALLGPGAVCRRTPEVPASTATPVGGPAVTLCGRGVADFAGETVPAAALPPPVTLPYEVPPERLAAVLGTGWRQGPGGSAWSEGPHSTLLIPVPTGHGLQLRLRASGVAFRPGEARVVRVSSGRLPVGEFGLPDGIVTEVVVAIPPSTITDGMLRVALDVVRPVDPARRGLAAPVKRAAILLSNVSLRVE